MTCGLEPDTRVTSVHNEKQEIWDFSRTFCVIIAWPQPVMADFGFILDFQ